MDSPRLSIRGDGGWHGMTRRSVMTNKPGELFMLQNGYVSGEGREIRSMPGWKPIIDLTGENGISRVTIEAERPTGDPAQEEDQRHYSFVESQYLHGFEQVRGRILVFGESDFRREIIAEGTPRADGTPPTEITIVSWVDSLGTFTFTLSGTPKGTTGFNGFNGIEIGDHVVVEDLAGITAAEWEWAIFLVVTVSPFTCTPVEGVLPNVASSGGTGKIYKVLFDLDGNEELWDRPSLTNWTVEQTPNTTTAVIGCQPAYCATQQRDYGDFIDATDNNNVEGHDGKPRRRQKQLPFRTAPDVAGNRLLLAAPGYGCVFQIPVITPPSDFVTGGITTEWNSVYDRPRSLGVPKAAILDAPEADKDQSPDVDSIVFDVSGAGLDVGAYKVQAAYKDEATGEIGLASEVLDVEITEADQGIQVYFKHPGYSMSECLALSVIVYISRTDGNFPGYVGTTTEDFRFSGVNIRYGLTSTIAGARPNIHGSAIITDTSTAAGSMPVIDLDIEEEPPVIPQMPRGSKAVRTVRGITLFGGHIGTHGLRKELQTGEASYVYKPVDGPNFPDRKILTVRAMDLVLDLTDAPWNMAMPGIPPAYAGTNILSNDGMFPEQTEQFQLDRMTNSFAFWLVSQTEYQRPERWAQRWILEQAPAKSTTIVGGQVDNRGKTGYLILGRGLYWWSEEGRPYESPSAAFGYLDAKTEDDVEAIGRHGESSILCTKENTYRLSFGRSPYNQFPQLDSPHYGCIGVNTMTEFDQGTAWMSGRGPVAKFGSAPPVWLDDLEHYFVGEHARYKKDSNGMMRHAISVFDDTRGLVIFGLYTDLERQVALPVYQYSDIGTATGDGFQVATTRSWDDCSDEERSRFPCNELLVWAPGRGFSIWHVDHDILWMRVLECEDGQRRLCFLSTDQKIYAFDDAWAVNNKDVVTAVADTAGAASSDFTANFSIFNVGNLTEVGMRYVIYDGTETNSTILGEGVLIAVIDDLNVTLSGIHTWPAGAILLVGVTPDMVVETPLMNADETGETQISGVSARCNLYSMITTANSTLQNTLEVPASLTLPQPEWFDVDVLVYKAGAPEFSSGLVGFTNNPDGPRFIGRSTTFNAALTTHVTRGRAEGGDLGVRATFKGAAQVRLSDLTLEVSSE